MQQNKKQMISLLEIKAGEFTKPEAARLITEGYQHIHSSPFGNKDPLMAATQLKLQNNSQEPYFWEKIHSMTYAIKSSQDREKVIDSILQSEEMKDKRFLRERVRIVLEELCTNAIYHAYQMHGRDKYSRTKKIALSESETVVLRFGVAPNGIFLQVEDKGGTFRLSDVQKSFSRCYGQNQQIESKESGAGLGLYMIFETVTHLKVELCENKMTKISAWLSDSKNFSPSIFSFNFFEWKE